jgi:hypothetical protein
MGSIELSEMKTHNFIPTAVDTDGISVCKPDFTDFSKEEVVRLITELNSYTEDLILWEYDGVVDALLVVKTKNYALYDGNSVEIKGSALKATTKEPALREMTHRMINSLLGIESTPLKQIYLEYVKEACKIKDIQRWGAKKSVTTAVLKPKATTQQKLNDAIKGKGFQVGEKFYVYFDEEKNLKCIEDFDGKYHIDAMLKKVFDSAKVFSTVYDIKGELPNFSLKKNKKELDKLLGNVVKRKSVIGESNG